MNDLRFTFRQLLKTPGFSLIVIVIATLALGIGANAAVFTILGVSPAKGRAFLIDEEKPGANDLLTYASVR